MAHRKHLWVAPVCLMIFVLIWGAIMLAITFAQQLPDAAKLAPVYQQQRNAEADGRAQCYAIVVELQARIADLQKQIDATKPKAPEK